MKVYTEVLKQFIPDLPGTEILKSVLTNHAFEVEEVIRKEKGDVIDLKVLPDRAHDALSHRGVAREIATHTGKVFNEVVTQALIPTTGISLVAVHVESELCHQYMALRIENVSIAKSPVWLSETLGALDQKSINTSVDLTNYVLFELGQPLHVFDADKIKGAITVRMARTGEIMTTLDNKELTLTEEMLVIADDEAVLALAGIKGGKKAEVDANTKSIILECANFDSISVRRTAFKVGIRTDASKRFENNYPAAWGEQALLRYVYLLQKEQSNISYGEVTDIYQNPKMPFLARVTTKRTNEWLGTQLSSGEISTILTKLHLEHVQKEDGIFEVTCNDNLFNIRSVDDQKYVSYQIIGHIGRVLGYDVGIQEKEYVPLKAQGQVVPYIAETDRIRNELVTRGFVEVRTYHFQNEGEEELENPIANDKKFIRSSLYLGMSEALAKATYNAPLLGRTDIFIFEIGTVVTKEKGEVIHLALSGFKQNQKKQKVTDVLKQTLIEIGLRGSVVKETENYVEVVISSHNELFEAEKDVVLLTHESQYVNWKPLSVYPFMTRDIAFFVSEEAKQKDLQEIFLLWAGALCVRVDMFDEFEKTLEDGTKKLSQAYRLVFQSQEKTLTDEEVNACMQNVEKEIKALGCEVR
jgi:phenylalanyl-tRNA synthetase beta chain